MRGSTWLAAAAWASVFALTWLLILQMVERTTTTKVGLVAFLALAVVATAWTSAQDDAAASHRPKNRSYEGTFTREYTRPVDGQGVPNHRRGPGPR